MTPGDDVFFALKWLATPAAIPLITVVLDLASINPALAWTKLLTVAEVQRLAGLASGNLIAGLASGAIIRDSNGGFIPAHGQSIFDPKTGDFTGQKT